MSRIPLLELLKTYEIDHFSFAGHARHEISHKGYDYLKEPNYELRSILKFEAGLPSFKLKHLFEVERQKIVSILDERINKEFFDRNNYYIDYWEKKLAKRKIIKEDDHKKYYNEIDKEVEKTRNELKAKFFTEVLEEEVYWILSDKYPNFENLEEEEMQSAIEDYLANPKKKEVLVKKITKSRIQTKYNRVFYNQVEKPLADLFGKSYNPWLQVYLVIDHNKKRIEHFTGGSYGSGSRQLHGFGVHLFAHMQPHKEIATECFFFKEDGSFNNYTEDSFIYLNQNTTGNYSLKQEESDLVLKNAKGITKATDLEFDLFIATGKKI